MMDDLKARLRTTYCEHRNKGVCLNLEVPYYCDVAVEIGLCPLAASRDKPKREKWEAVKV